MEGIVNATKELFSGQKPFSAMEDAEALHTAMKGAGTNERTVIDIVGNRNAEQLQQVRREYQELTQGNLMTDLEKEFSGYVQKAILGTIMSPTEYDATCLHDSLSGMGTDEQVLIDHLVHRTTVEIQDISIKYKQLYNKVLVDKVGSELSGESKKFFTALLMTERQTGDFSTQQLKTQCEALYNAGQGRTLGTDEKTFIGVLTSYSPDYLKQLNEQYGNLYGDNLFTAVKKEMSGTVGKAFSALLMGHDDYYADALDKAISGGGTDEDRLVRIIVSRREQLRSINSVFMKEKGKSIVNRIEAETSGDLSKILSAICRQHVA